MDKEVVAHIFFSWLGRLDVHDARVIRKDSFDSVFSDERNERKEREDTNRAAALIALHPIQRMTVDRLGPPPTPRLQLRCDSADNICNHSKALSREPPKLIGMASRLLMASHLYKTLQSKIESLILQRKFKRVKFKKLEMFYNSRGLSALLRATEFAVT